MPTLEKLNCERVFLARETQQATGSASGKNTSRVGDPKMCFRNEHGDDFVVTGRQISRGKLQGCTKIMSPRKASKH